MSDIDGMDAKSGILLTSEQIKHWRTVLCSIIGPYALIMPDSDVQRLRDVMQTKADALLAAGVTP
jgi:hypothetical protein